MKARAGDATSPRAGDAVPPRVWIACALWAALLLLAPPDSNAFWGVNGWRAIEWPARIAILGLAALLAWWAARGRAWPAGALLLVGTGIAATLSFVAFERTHFLGDTGVRTGALSIFVRGLTRQSLAAWAAQIHAAPLDLAVDFLLPAGLVRLGLTPEGAIRAVSFALGVAFLAGVWRLSGTLGAPAARRAPLAAALVLNGTLLVFAGYAESAALQMVAAVWWWSLLMAPLRSRASAWWIAAGWLVLVLAHRTTWGWLPVLALRLLDPAFAQDDPRCHALARRTSLAAVILALAPLALARGTMGYDFSEMFAALSRPGDYGRSIVDALNVLVLIAPLGLFAPVLVGASYRLAPATTARLRLIALATLPLLPLVYIVSRVESWMGAQREWDATVLIGLTLTLGATVALATLPDRPLRRVLTLVLPLLAVGAFGWIAIQSDEAVGLARARALATARPSLPAGQRSNVYLYLARWAASRNQPLEAAQAFEQSYALAPSPNRGLLAARAWGQLGRVADLRRLIASVRAHGGLTAETREAADSLEAQGARLEAELARARGPASP